MASKPTVMDHSVHERGWQNFGRFLTVSIVVISLILIGMAVFLL